MSASDEFPRGWDVQTSQNATLVAAEITVPAVPGVSHILTGVNAILGGVSAAALSYSSSINTSGGVAIVNFGWLRIADGVGAGGQFSDKDTFNWTGKIAFPVNTAINIGFGIVAAANILEILEIQGYDI